MNETRHFDFYTNFSYLPNLCFRKVRNAAAEAKKYKNMDDSRHHRKTAYQMSEPVFKEFVDFWKEKIASNVRTILTFVLIFDRFIEWKIANNSIFFYLTLIWKIELNLFENRTQKQLP